MVVIMPNRWLLYEFIYICISWFIEILFLCVLEFSFNLEINIYFTCEKGRVLQRNFNELLCKGHFYNRTTNGISSSLCWLRFGLFQFILFASSSAVRRMVVVYYILFDKHSEIESRMKRPLINKLNRCDGVWMWM